MIVTFYSFKGGVGRSFSLVECAAQLAARGASVVVWDLDLEAPGLQKIPCLARQIDPILKSGTLDLLLAFEKSRYETFPEKALSQSIVPFELPDATSGGRLDFLLPGKFGESYGEAFRSIGWTRLFARRNAVGPAFFLRIAHFLQQDLGYEYVLIDARTGFTDLGAVCTMVLADLVVIVFNLNEQNLTGIEQVHLAVTETPHPHFGAVPVFLLANMVPEAPEDVRQEKLKVLAEKGLRPHLVTPLRPALLLTEEVPTLSGKPKDAAAWRPLADEIESRRCDLEASTADQRREHLQRARTPGEIEALRKRGIYEKAKRFEEKVAELFQLLGYKTVVDYKKDDMQFDVRLEMAGGPLPTWAMVECKDVGRKIGQRDVRDFAGKVDHAKTADRRPYQAIMVSRSGFANNAHTVAEQQFVQLLTFEQLLLSLIDLEPNLDAAVRGYRGTALERLYVEQDVVLQSELQPGKEVTARPVFEAVHAWLEKPGAPFLTLLGDFGSGKTSFCKRLACELALEARDHPGRRAPVLIDLREGGSTTVTLESLLTHHFQRLSSRPFNPQALLRLNVEGYLVLFFDGFDETLGYTEPSRFVEILRQILRAAGGTAKVVLTCRTHYFRDRPEEVRRLGRARDVLTTEGATRLYEELREQPGTDIAYLREFTSEQIDEYLEKALPPPADWQAFRDEIRRTYNLQDLAERPFLLEIIVKTLPKLRAAEGGGAVTLADLYETYCESWFSHTDFRLTLTRERKVALVEYLARMIWDAPGQRVHYEELFEKSTEFFRDQPLTPYDKEKIDYEVRTALFLHRDARGYYSFIHRSFLEFFVARTLRTGLREGDPGCLDLRRLTREVAFFLVFWPEAERARELAAQILTRPYRPRVSENALLLLYFVARSAAGSLVGPGSELDDADLETVRTRFAALRSETLELDGADLAATDLRAADLHGASLRGAQLESTDLRGAVLDGARLDEASLAQADLRRASLAGAVLTRADLHHADGRRTGFREADLTAADLSFARLARADLRDAELRESRQTGTGFLHALGVESREPAEGLRLVVQRGHSRNALCVAWSSNGHFLASGSLEGILKIWDVVAGTLLRTLAGHAGAVFSVAWEPSGERLASGSSDHTVTIWNVADGRELHALRGHEAEVHSVAWSPSGERLASGSEDHTIKIWNVADGRELHALHGHEDGVRSVAWGPSGERLASGSLDHTVKIWHAEDGRELHTLHGHQSGVPSVAWDPSGERLASGSLDHTVKIWNVGDGRELHTLDGHVHGVFSVVWERSGERLASGSFDQTIKIWNATDGRERHTLTGSKHGVVSMAWDPNGKRLAFSYEDQTVKIWNVGDDRELYILTGHEHRVRSVAWDPGGEQLASGSDDQTVKIWNVGDGRELRTLTGHQKLINSVVWDPNGERLASGSADHTVKIWNVGNGRELRTLHGHRNAVLSVVWDPNGKRLASGSDDLTVRIWNARDGRVLHTLPGHEGRIPSVAWDPSGERLASGSWDHTARIWHAEDGRVLHTLTSHEYRVNSVAWDPSGERLASGSADKTVKIWHAGDGGELHTLPGHKSWVLSVAWDPSGERLASGSMDHTVKIWHAESGRLLHTLTEHEDWVAAVAWSADGGCLAAATLGGWIDLWDVAASEPRRVARFYEVSDGAGFAVTVDGDVSGPPESLELVRFADGWALYDIDDLPERISPERVAAALRRVVGRTSG